MYDLEAAADRMREIGRMGPGLILAPIYVGGTGSGHWVGFLILSS
jgi:hypothetical protein